MTPTRNAHRDAETTDDLVLALNGYLRAARACGWTVNLAVETGGGMESVSFTASKPTGISDTLG